MFFCEGRLVLLGQFAGYLVWLFSVWCFLHGGVVWVGCLVMPGAGFFDVSLSLAIVAHKLGPPRSVLECVFGSESAGFLGCCCCCYVAARLLFSECVGFFQASHRYHLYSYALRPVGLHLVDGCRVSLGLEHVCIDASMFNVDGLPAIHGPTPTSLELSLWL